MSICIRFAIESFSHLKFIFSTIVWSENVPHASSVPVVKKDGGDPVASISKKKSSKNSKKGSGFTLLLARPMDTTVLNSMHVCIRRQVEVFKATKEDINEPAPGRKNRIREGQVGLRCIHCRHFPPHKRVKRAVCYPTSVGRIYHSVSDMKIDHFMACPGLQGTARQDYERTVEEHKKSSDSTKEKKKKKRKRNANEELLSQVPAGCSSSTAQYYYDSATEMGMVDGDKEKGGVFFRKSQFDPTATNRLPVHLRDSQQGPVAVVRDKPRQYASSARGPPPPPRHYEQAFSCNHRKDSEARSQKRGRTMILSSVSEPQDSFRGHPKNCESVRSPSPGPPPPTVSNSVGAVAASNPTSMGDYHVPPCPQRQVLHAVPTTSHAYTITQPRVSLPYQPNTIPAPVSSPALLVQLAPPQPAPEDARAPVSVASSEDLVWILQRELYKRSQQLQEHQLLLSHILQSHSTKLSSSLSPPGNDPSTLLQTILRNNVLGTEQGTLLPEAHQRPPPNMLIGGSPTTARSEMSNNRTVSQDSSSSTQNEEPVNETCTSNPESPSPY